MTARARVGVALLLATVVALALRLPDLDLRPVHADEAVHAYKLNTLWQTGRYTYDPREYHGPTLYYLTMPIVWASGAADWVGTTITHYRLVPVLAGVALIPLLFLLRDGLGNVAIIAAAGLTALSPAMVFYSRYYIQETLLVLFVLAVIAALWRFGRSRRWGWAVAAGVALGLMHATKETWLISAVAMIVAFVLTHLTTLRQSLRSLPVWPLVAMIAIAAVVSTALLAAFFTNPSAALDSLATYGAYADRAGGAGHDKPWHYYLHLLLYTHRRAGPVWTEAFIIILALIGMLAAATGYGLPRDRRTLPRFLAVYAVLLFAAYSVIPYKTPWCILGPLHALILVAGVGVAALWHSLRLPWPRAALLIALLLPTLHLARLSWRTNHDRVFSNDPRNPWIYAPTVRDTERLATRLTQLAALDPAGDALLIKAVVDNPWPLPWYLRGFTRVGYWNTPPDDVSAPVVLVGHANAPDVLPALADTHQAMIHGLRRDEVLTVFIARDLWEAYMRSRSPTSDPRGHP
jgi:uncharacterized protein (TIGR03663 family)